MEIVVVDYRLCAFFYGYHKHKPITAVISNIARTLTERGIVAHKLIFAVDVGRSKRVLKYPAYKMQRREKEKKESPAEQKRREKFNEDYHNSINLLKQFATVIDINGIEADDIGSIIAHRFANTEHNVTLFSSDKDWASFLVADNIKMLRLSDTSFITRNNCEDMYNLDPTGVFYEQIFVGSDKENVQGIRKFGEKTFKKIYAKEKTLDGLIEVIQTDILEKAVRGAHVPEGMTFEGLVSLNYDLFKPVTFEDLESKEQELFLEKFSNKSGGDFDAVAFNALMDYGLNLSLSTVEKQFYKLT